MWQNFKPGIPPSKDFRNEVIQLAAMRPISEICERYHVNHLNVWLQVCHVCTQLEHVFLSRNSNAFINNFLQITTNIVVIA